MSKVYEALEHAAQDKERRKSSVVPPVSNFKDERIDGPDEDVEDEMISLYQSIVASLPLIPKRIVMFIGSKSNEGTSTMAKRFARVCSARLGKKVLLMDLDRSRPDLNVFLNVKPEYGLEEAVAGGHSVERALCQIEETSLYVMPLFQQSMTTPKTIDFAKHTDMWGLLREQFDLIVVDSPPATLFPDGPAMVSLVDGVIIVVEAEKTRWQVAQSVKNKIEKHGGNILGVLFNKRRFYIPDFIYSRL